MKHFTLTTLAAFALILTITLANPLPAQTTKPKPAAAKEESKYQIAQRNLTTAIANLEAYLQENPNGKDAPVARIQLKGLKNLMTSMMKIQAVMFFQPGYDNQNSPGYNEIEWYVETVDRQEDKTRITLVITNRNDKEERTFWGFDKSPLILVDNKGNFYSMQSAPDCPESVKKIRINDNRDQWVLEGGRTIRITVDFAPFAPESISGKVMWKDANNAEPAAFSLLNTKQKPADK